MPRLQGILQETSHRNTKQNSLGKRSFADLELRKLSSPIEERQRSGFRQKVGRSIISSHSLTFRHHMGESVQVESRIASLRS